MLQLREWPIFWVKLVTRFNTGQTNYNIFNMVNAREFLFGRVLSRERAPVLDYFRIAHELVDLQVQLLSWSEQRMSKIGIVVPGGNTRIWSVNAEVVVEHNKRCFEVMEYGDGVIGLAPYESDHDSLDELEFEELGGELLGSSPLFATFVGRVRSTSLTCIQLAPNPWDDQAWYLKYLERNQFRDQTLDNFYPLEAACIYMHKMAKQCGLGIAA